MKVESLKRAIALAKQFVTVAEKVQVETSRCFDGYGNLNGETYEYVVVGITTGAAKRASMDLTRALAEMRKP